MLERHNNTSGIRGLLNHHLSNDDLNDIYNQIRMLEPLITQDLLTMSKELGIDFQGLEFTAKTAISIEDKLQRLEKQSIDYDAEAKLLEMKDIIRYTEICKHEDIANITRETIDRMKDKGYVLSGIANYYNSQYPDTEYKGMHLNFISPYGQEIEVQVHSPESFAAKQEGHSLYEKMRAVATLERDKEDLKKEITRIHGTIQNPPGIETLPTKYENPDKMQIIKERREKVDIEFMETSSFSK